MKPMRTYLVNGQISKKVTYTEWIKGIVAYLETRKLLRK
jgi:hypothetical protein|tara:strand:+ start:733 stop:849 length:117 start_codon:yes stop_codon:yes gene_type:complete